MKITISNNIMQIDLTIQNYASKKNELEFMIESTEKDIADMMGISRQQLQNYKKLTEMIPELEELVDTGITTPTTALARNNTEILIAIISIL